MSVMYIIKSIRNLFFFKYINKLHRIKTANNKTIDQGIKLAKKPESVLSNTNNKNKEINGNIKEVEIKEESLNNFTQEQINSIFVNYKKLTNLTAREKDVLSFILSGEKRKNIASSLFITESAVKKHTANIFKKLGVESRMELYKKVKKYI